MSTPKPQPHVEITPTEGLEAICLLRREVAQLKAELAEAESRALELAKWLATANIRAADARIAFESEMQRHLDTMSLCRKFEHQRDSLRAALEAVEWVSRNDSFAYSWCPWCKEVASHNPACQRQAALGGEEEE